MLRAVVVSVLLGLAGLGLVLLWLGEDLTFAVKVPAWAYAVGLALALLNYLTGTWRIQVLARLDGVRVGFKEAIRAYALGLFSAAITPGNTGQAPTMVLSLAADGVPARNAWSMAVMIWISDLLFLALTLPVSVLVMARSTRLISGYYPGMIAGVLFASSLLVLWILIYRMRWIQKLASQLMRLPILKRWRAQVVEFIGRLEQSGKTLWRAPLSRQLFVHACTAVVYLSTYFTFYVVMASLRPNTPLLTTMAAAQLPTVAASFFPTPGGAGLLEVTAATLVRGKDTAAAILAWRLLTHYLRMLVGPVLGAHVISSVGALFGNSRRAEGEA